MRPNGTARHHDARHGCRASLPPLLPRPLELLLQRRRRLGLPEPPEELHVRRDARDHAVLEVAAAPDLGTAAPRAPDERAPLAGPSRRAEDERAREQRLRLPRGDEHELGRDDLGLVEAPDEREQAQELLARQDPRADPESMNRFLAVEAEQNRLDQTVWAKERLAQRYEEVFIKLWDDLRNETNRFGVLENFSFGELQLGKPEKMETHDWGIQRTHYRGAAERLTPATWRQLLQKLKNDGYQIEQTEWRHPRFAAEADSPAVSVIAMTLHILNPGRQTRLILKGDLRVEWEKNTAPDRAMFPRLIDASQIEIIQRQGEPAFREVVAKKLAPAANNIFIDPLILYDLDGDGLSEIIFSCKNLVYWNRGNGKFESAPLLQHPPSLIYAAIIADFSGDGLADFLCADKAGVLLFKGDLRGKFMEPGERVWSAPVKLPNPIVITAGDIDGDGDLDVWLAQYKLPYVSGQMPTPYYDANDGFPSFLLVNDGRGQFQDQTESAGLAKKRFRRTYSSSFVDLDDDGDLDLVVVSDFAGVDVYENDGRGHFRDVTATAVDEPHCFGMAHTFGDYDLDGRLDFFVIGMDSVVAQRLDAMKLGPEEFAEYQKMRPRMSYGNRMYLARDHAFKQTELSDQVAQTGWSWGATSFDFDNDGDLDIYVANGHKSNASAKDYESQFWCHDIYVSSGKRDPVWDLYFKAVASRLYGLGYSYGGYAKNRLLMNEAGKSFLEIGWLMDVALELDCRNAASDDLDGDGRVDVMVTTFEE